MPILDFIDVIDELVLQCYVEARTDLERQNGPNEASSSRTAAEPQRKRAKVNLSAYIVRTLRRKLTVSEATARRKKPRTDDTV